MPQVQNIRHHDYTFRLTTSTGLWCWTTRLDVSQASPTYFILDIVSPYGLLRDSIPIPGEVIQAMSDSITELKTAFAPRIALGPPSSPIVFTVDEGFGFYPAQTATVTNSGQYGSILNTSITSSAAWLSTMPVAVGGLALNESGTFQVLVTSKNLVATSSPYSGTLTLQDSTAANSPQVYNVTVNVRPLSTISLSTATITFNVVKPLSGPFPSISDQTFTVTNTGPSGSLLSYQINKLTGLSPWLTSITPSSGSLVHSAADTITLSVVPPDSMTTGTYTETLVVSGYSSNLTQNIQIQLVIS